LNNLDGIFTRQGGNFSVMSVELVQENSGFSGGVIATVTLGINSSAIPDPVQGGFGPPPTPPPSSTDPPTTTRSSNGNTFTMMSSTLILLHIIFYVYTILE
jgi:hypothetical protein